MLFKKHRKSKELLFEEMIISKDKELYRLAYYYVKNENDALDILQDSILKAFINLHKLKELGAMEKWIKKIVINTSIDFIRKDSKISITGQEALVNMEEAVNHNENLILSIDDLDEELKSIIILKYFHGYTINEVGEMLDLPISQVKNKLHKALKLLRVDMKEEYYE